MGIVSSALLMIVLIFEFFTNKDVVPDVWNQMNHAKLFIWNWQGVVETIPFIVFLYMY